jgi:hypothetical protein
LTDQIPSSFTARRIEDPVVFQTFNVENHHWYVVNAYFLDLLPRPNGGVRTPMPRWVPSTKLISTREITAYISLCSQTWILAVEHEVRLSRANSTFGTLMSLPSQPGFGSDAAFSCTSHY